MTIAKLATNNSRETRCSVDIIDKLVEWSRHSTSSTRMSRTDSRLPRWHFDSQPVFRTCQMAATSQWRVHRPPRKLFQRWTEKSFPGIIYLLKYKTKGINASNMLLKAVQKPSHFIREQMSKREIKWKKIRLHNSWPSDIYFILTFSLSLPTLRWFCHLRSACGWYDDYQWRF